MQAKKWPQSQFMCEVITTTEFHIWAKKKKTIQFDRWGHQGF
jgi:hypothetical protein